MTFFYLFSLLIIIICYNFFYLFLFINNLLKWTYTNGVDAGEWRTRSTLWLCFIWRDLVLNIIELSQIIKNIKLVFQRQFTSPFQRKREYSELEQFAIWKFSIHWNLNFLSASQRKYICLLGHWYYSIEVFLKSKINDSHIPLIPLLC